MRRPPPSHYCIFGKIDVFKGKNGRKIAFFFGKIKLFIFIYRNQKNFQWNNIISFIGGTQAKTKIFTHEKFNFLTAYFFLKPKSANPHPPQVIYYILRQDLSVKQSILRQDFPPFFFSLFLYYPARYVGCLASSADNRSVKQVQLIMNQLNMETLSLFFTIIKSKSLKDP